MKNKFIEQKIKKSKRYAKSWAGKRKLNQNGNYVIHAYDEPRTLSWGDDVIFKLGSQVVMVVWTHPRSLYHHLCEEIINKQMPFTAVPINQIMTTTPNYQKTGKKRQLKKIVNYNINIDPEFSAHCKKRREKTKEFLKESDIVVKPSMSVEQLDWCRYVKICMPIEIFNENDIDELAKITKQLLLRQTTLTKLFPNYQYDKNSWNSELDKMGDWVL